MAAKYFDTSSYSNTFVEKLSENSVLVLYNNLKYDDGDGLRHKAAFVRKNHGRTLSGFIGKC